ncbi:hypothetical protein HDU97_002885 [Phlyctochytrium planicorne]|nr:hypothetical protein HDU97_002885 [Phlyctochytrium planicorne]
MRTPIIIAVVLLVALAILADASKIKRKRRLSRRRLNSGVAKAAKYIAFTYEIPGKGLFKFETGLKPWPYLRVSTFASRGAESSGANSTSFATSLIKVVEYADLIPISNSTSFVDFKDLDSSWSNFNFANTTLADGAVSLTALSTFSLPGSTFTANFSVTTVSKATNITTPIGPNGNPRKTPMKVSEVKFSFGFAGFPYALRNSSLAIVSGLFSGQPRRAGRRPGDDGPKPIASGAAPPSSTSSPPPTVSAPPTIVNFDTAGYLTWVSEVLLPSGNSLNITADPDLYTARSVNVSLPVKGTPPSAPAGPASPYGSPPGQSSGQQAGGPPGNFNFPPSETADFVVYRIFLNNTRPSSFLWDPSLGLNDTNPAVASTLGGDVAAVAANDAIPGTVSVTDADAVAGDATSGGAPGAGASSGGVLTGGAPAGGSPAGGNPAGGSPAGGTSAGSGGAAGSGSNAAGPLTVPKPSSASRFFSTHVNHVVLSIAAIVGSLFLF